MLITDLLKKLICFYSETLLEPTHLDSVYLLPVIVLFSLASFRSLRYLFFYISLNDLCLHQGFTNFPKICESPKKFKCQMCDKK